MATTEVERIVVGLGFATDEQSVKKALGAYKSVVAGAGAVAAAIGSALVASAGFTLTMAASVATTQDLANALSMSTEEYTALAYAMDMAGVSQEKMRVGLTTLQRKLGDAGKGSKEAGALFDRLGVNIRDADGNLKTSSQVLLEVGDGIKNLGSDGEKTAMLLQLFGEAGGAFKELFKNGALGIKDFIAEAKKLGIVLDSDVAEAGAQLDDSFVKLKKVVGALGLAFADDLFPPMKVLVEQLTAFLADSDGFVRSGIDRAAKTMGRAFEFLATDAGKAALAIGGVTAAVSGAQGVAGLVTALGPAGSAMMAFAGTFGKTAIKAAPLVAVLALLYLAYDELKVTAEGGDSAIRRFGKTLGIETETVKLATSTFHAFGDSFDALSMFASEAEKSISVSLRDIARALDIEMPEEWSALGALFERMAGNIGRISSGFNKLRLYMSGDERIETTSFGEAALSVPSLQSYVINSARERNLGLPEQRKAETAVMMEDMDRYYAERGVINAQGQRVDMPGVSVPLTVNIAKGASDADVEKAVNSQLRAGLREARDLQ